MSDYQQIISAIQQVPGVSGAAVIGSNGQVEQSTLPDAAPEMPGVASQIFTNIGVQTKRMQRGTLQRLVLETEEGITLLSGLARGELLVVYAAVVDGFNLAKLIEVASKY
ncbi:MAG: roadblock/LC7 domain-containing protein [Candidatus Sericytochromatia bacterium]